MPRVLRMRSTVANFLRLMAFVNLMISHFEIFFSIIIRFITPCMTYHFIYHNHRPINRMMRSSAMTLANVEATHPRPRTCMRRILFLNNNYKC